MGRLPSGKLPDGAVTSAKLQDSYWKLDGKSTIVWRSVFNPVALRRVSSAETRPTR